MENYERDDAFFDIANRNKIILDEEEQRKKDIAREVYTFSKQIAQANARTKMIGEQTKKVERARRIKAWIAAGSIVATLGLGLGFTAVHGSDITKSINETKDTNTGKAIMVSNATIKLIGANLAVNDGSQRNNFIVKNNLVSEYKQLNISNVEDVLIYMGLLPQEEFDKFIKSVFYYDVEGNENFYSSFDEFLKVNGYESVRDFEKKADDIILEKYKNGEIEHMFYEGIRMSDNRGGR